MLSYCSLAVLMLVLTFDDQVHADEIIGGHEALPHSRPYMVLLEWKNHWNKVKHCDGFLLNEDFVMTAAHCKAKSYQVFLGLHNYIDKQKMSVSVKQAFPHKGYHRNRFRNDIMLLKLSSKANFSNIVKPITLADQDKYPLPKSCSVSGWGQTNMCNRSMSFTLMEVNVTLSDKKICAKENVYCSVGKTGPLKGDSGGPLVCEDGKAYGVVSVSIQLQHGYMLHKYTKIPDNRELIDLIMKDN